MEDDYFEGLSQNFKDLMIELNLDKYNGIENFMSLDINEIAEKVKLKMQMLNITEEQIINEFNNLKNDEIFNDLPDLKDLIDKISSLVNLGNTEIESFFNELREIVQNYQYM